MSLIDFIQKIQKKPRHVRVQFLWLAVFVSMIIIVSLWVVTLKGSLSNKEEETKSDELVESLNDVKEQIPSLLDSLKANVGSLFEKDVELENQLIKETSPMNEEMEQPTRESDIAPGKLPLSKTIND